MIHKRSIINDRTRAVCMGSCVYPKRNSSSSFSTGQLLQRMCGCGAEKQTERDINDHKHFDTSSKSTALVVPPVVHEVLCSPGQPVPGITQAYFAPRFGYDFSQVRVHTGVKASESAHAMDALAYTVGPNIVFDTGRCSMDARNGLSLWAHELAHVMQQKDCVSQTPEDLKIEAKGSSAENEADSIAQAAAGWKPLPPVSNFRRQIMRATRTFALTFDDGPHSAKLGAGINRTEKVLDTLKAKGIKAGFFVQTGVSYRGASPVGRKLIARMHAEGHKIGIHTGGSKDHELHTTAEKAGRLKGELESAKTFIEKETDEIPTLVRPPTGASDKAVRATYVKVSLANLLWDMDGDQGKELSLKTLKDRVQSEMSLVQNRGWQPTTSSPHIVVLYHDIKKNTSDNLDQLIEHIKATTHSLSAGKDSATFSAP